MTATAPARKMPQRGEPLHQRELRVLDGMARGLTNRQIGAEQSLPEDTVKSHARRLFAKLGARDRAHAVAIGYQQGLLEGGACTCREDRP